MKTKSLLVLSLVGAAAVVDVGAIGVSGIAINSNVEATSSKTMVAPARMMAFFAAKILDFGLGNIGRKQAEGAKEP